MDEANLLIMTDITKEFPGVIAVNRARFELRSGEVHALVGENGAGKTTLMNILNGVIVPDEGRIFVRGVERHIPTPQIAQSLGIAFIHQELNLINELTVKENFFLGRELVTRAGLIDWREMKKRTEQVLSSFEIDVDPDIPVGQLSVAQKQMVEIARALTIDAEIIVMDEPTSSLTDEETLRLFDLIRQLKSEGKGVIYISHRMEEIFEIADRVTVMRNGQYVGTKLTAETDRDEIVKMMVGEDVATRYPKEQVPAGETVLRVENLYGPKLVRDVTFELRSGEILGVAGLIGSGRTELLELIYGVYRPVSGSMYLSGSPYKPRLPREAIRRGVTYVPEDRELKGLFLNFDVFSNVSVSKVDCYSPRGIVDANPLVEGVTKLVDRLGIVTPSIYQTTRNLSGGNRQKCVLAKCVYAGMRILLINEPTRGVDVGAKAEIYRLLYELAKQDVGIIMVSSELPEVMEVSDRIMVVHEGAISAMFRRGEASKEDVLRAMTVGARPGVAV